MIAVPEEPRYLGVSGFVGFATRVNGYISAGIEAAGWTGDTNFPTLGRTQLGIHGVGYLYPSLQSRLFLKGGLGVGAVTIDPVDGDGGDSGMGLGLLMGLGYDFPVWSETGLSVYVDVPFVRKFRGGVPNVIQVGVGLAR